MIADEEFDAALFIMRQAADPAQVAVDQMKLDATLAARAALVGIELVRMPGGDYVVGRWGMVRALGTAAQVDQFLQQVSSDGVPRTRESP